MTDPISDIKYQIADRYRIFETCLKEKDIEKLFKEFYSDSILFQGTDVPLTIGRDQLFPMLEGMSSAIADVRVEQLETRVMGNGESVCDLALVHATLEDGSKGTDRSCCVFVKTAVGWRCEVDVFLRP